MDRNLALEVVRVTDVKRVSLTFRYELFRDGAFERPLCTGHTVHACVTREGRPSRLPEPLLRLLQPAAP